MLTGALITLTMLAAPEDAAAQLRIAWASQYEWRESGVSNAALEFTYSYHWKGLKDQEWRYEGRGQVVVVGTEIVRRHYPGATESRRKQIDSHIAWAVGRFVRKPFEEEFKQMTFEGPDPTEDGFLRISVAPKESPSAKRYFLLKDGRLAGREWRLGTPEDPKFNRLTYATGEVGDGYAVLGEDTTWTHDGATTSTTRRLDLAKGDEYPYPKSYSYRLSSNTGTADVHIDFVAPAVNARHPVVGDPAARDALKEGWGHRYVLPNDIHIEAQFHRRVDNDLAKLGWWDTVKGSLQVWGMDEINAALDERLFPDQSWTGEIQRLCEEHFRRLFGWMHDKPFEKAFRGCGFEFIEAKDETVAVLVFGYEGARGFLLQDGRIVGYLRNAGVEEGWWRFRLKKTRAGKFRIESMSSKLGRDVCTLGIKYKRMKGVEIPRSFEVIGGSRRGSKDDGYGVAEYSLKKVKVSFPR